MYEKETLPLLTLINNTIKSRRIDKKNKNVYYKGTATRMVLHFDEQQRLDGAIKIVFERHSNEEYIKRVVTGRFEAGQVVSPLVFKASPKSLGYSQKIEQWYDKDNHMIKARTTNSAGVYYYGKNTEELKKQDEINATIKKGLLMFCFSVALVTGVLFIAKSRTDNVQQKDTSYQRR